MHDACLMADDPFADMDSQVRRAEEHLRAIGEDPAEIIRRAAEKLAAWRASPASTYPDAEPKDEV